MKRRKFFDKSLKKITIAGIGASTIFAPNILKAKNKKHTWVAVSAFDKAGILGRAFQKLCDDITRISSGKLNIRLFHANELVSALDFPAQ